MCWRNCNESEREKDEKFAHVTTDHWPPVHTYKLVSLVSAQFSSQHNSVMKCLATVFGFSERPLLNVSQTGSISLGAVKRSVSQAVAENHACNITCETIQSIFVWLPIAALSTCTHLMEFLLIDIRRFGSHSQSIQHRFEQRDVLGTKQLHFIFAGIAECDANGQTDFRASRRRRFRLCRCVTGEMWRRQSQTVFARILPFAHHFGIASAFATQITESTCGCGAGRRIHISMVGKESNEIVIREMILKRCRHVPQYSSLHATDTAASIDRRVHQNGRVDAQLPSTQMTARIVAEHRSDATASRSRPIRWGMRGLWFGWHPGIGAAEPGIAMRIVAIILVYRRCHWQGRR